MAKLIEIDEFTEEVYQLEVTDFVEGGENGADNRPHKALANRTKWLKSKIDSILAQVEPFYFTDKTLPSATTKQKYLFDVVSANTTDGLPAGVNFWWIDTKFYRTKESSKYQTATQYVVNGQSRVFTRSYYSPNWTPWVENLTAVSIVQVLTTTGGYRVEPADESGKRLITQWGKVTTNSENYAVIFPITFSTVPMVKINFEEPTYNSAFAPSYFATNSRMATGFKITHNGSAMLGGYNIMGSERVLRWKK